MNFRLLNYFKSFFYIWAIMQQNKIKIAILELASHHEVVRSFAFMALASNYEVLIVTTLANSKFLMPVFDSQVEWLIMDQAKSTLPFLTHHKAEIEKCDILLFTSIEDLHGNVIDLKWVKPTLAMLHHPISNFCYSENISRPTTFKLLLKTVKYRITRFYEKRRLALNNLDVYLLPSTSAKGYFFEKNISEYSKCKALPFLFYEQSNSTVYLKQKIFVVPGTVNQKSRNYFDLLYAIGELNKHEEYTATLVLLGSIKKGEGKSILENFKQNTGKHIELIHFENEISTETFDYWIKNASVLLLPLSKKTVYGIVNSIGGLLSVSGNIGDMVRFGKRAILPHDYFIEPDLEGLAHRYQNENHLLDIMKKLFKEQDKNHIENDLDILSKFNKIQIERIKEIVETAI
jgi:hypothetical protein